MLQICRGDLSRQPRCGGCLSDALEVGQQQQLVSFGEVAGASTLYVRHTPEQQVCILNTTYKRQIIKYRQTGLSSNFFPGPVA